ncbi:MAG TPA: hypothetical protein ENI80_06820 [Acidiferrobacteraceae bacterium]|nr:hypothetical protein [Acidiferrobacteraceae bacterium]
MNRKVLQANITVSPSLKIAPDCTGKQPSHRAARHERLPNKYFGPEFGKNKPNKAHSTQYRNENQSHYQLECLLNGRGAVKRFRAWFWHFETTTPEFLNRKGEDEEILKSITYPCFIPLSRLFMP